MALALLEEQGKIEWFFVLMMKICLQMICISFTQLLSNPQIIKPYDLQLTKKWHGKQNVPYQQNPQKPVIIGQGQTELCGKQH